MLEQVVAKLQDRFRIGHLWFSPSPGEYISSNSRGGQYTYNFSRAVFEGDTNNTAKIVLVRMYTQRKATTISVAGRL